MDNVGCTGSELSLFDCRNSYYGDCNANEGAGVICEFEPLSNTTVELVGGNDTVGNVLLDGRPIWYKGNYRDFSCEGAALEVLMSVRLCVRLSSS